MKFNTKISKSVDGKHEIRGHDAINLMQNRSFAEAVFLLLRGDFPDEKEKALLEENKKQDFSNLLELFFEILDLQKEKNIPILTVSLGKKEDIDEDILFDNVKLILKKANEYKMRVTIYGRWYDLKGQLVEELKKQIESLIKYAKKV